MNITDIVATNITGVNDVFLVANTASGNVFFSAVYLVLYMILFSVAASRSQRPSEALASSSFVMFVIGTLLVLSGLINMYLTVLPLVLLAVSLYALMSP